MAGKTPEFYLISTAAELLDMHPQTLRKYERLGLVRPPRTLGSMRMYTRGELDRLRLIKTFVDGDGINLAGVHRLLSIVEVAERLRPLIERRARRAAAAGRPAASRRRSRERCYGCWGLTTRGDRRAHGIQGLLHDARHRQDRGGCRYQDAPTANWRASFIPT